MIKLRLTLADGLSSKDIFIFLSKHHPFLVFTREDLTVINDGTPAGSGGWRVREPIDTVLDMIEEQMT
jgi:hypothetical protein